MICTQSSVSALVSLSEGAWLAGWLVGWLVGWVADWLAGWLGGWLAGWLVFFFFYILSTWKVPTCDSAHSWRLYSAAPSAP